MNLPKFNDTTSIKVYKITDEMKKEVGGITYLEDFENEYKNKEGGININYLERWKFLKNIQDYIITKYNCTNLDPIEYLVYLYSKDGENLDIKEIFYKLKNNNLLKSDKILSLRSFLKNTLKWNIRKNPRKINQTRKSISSNKEDIESKINKILYLIERNNTPENKMKIEIGGIQNLCNFLEKYKKVNGELNNTYKNIYNFFINVREYIITNKNYPENTDPINYLTHLYSRNGEGLSINEIHNIFKDFWKDKSLESFRKIFKNTLGWKLRNNNDRTESNKIKFEKSMKNIIINGDEKFLNELNKIFNLNGINNINDFNKEEFEKIIFIKDKIIYILCFILGVNKNELIQKLNLLKNNGIGIYVMKRGLNTIMTNYGKGLPIIEINKSNLNCILNQKELPN